MEETLCNKIDSVTRPKLNTTALMRFKIENLISTTYIERPLHCTLVIERGIMQVSENDYLSVLQAMRVIIVLIHNDNQFSHSDLRHLHGLENGVGRERVHRKL